MHPSKLFVIVWLCSDVFKFGSQTWNVGMPVVTFGWNGFIQPGSSLPVGIFEHFPILAQCTVTSIGLMIGSYNDGNDLGLAIRLKQSGWDDSQFMIEKRWILAIYPEYIQSGNQVEAIASVLLVFTHFHKCMEGFGQATANSDDKGICNNMYRLRWLCLTESKISSMRESQRYLRMDSISPPGCLCLAACTFVLYMQSVAG